MGMTFQPIRRQGSAAAAGTTPFGVPVSRFQFLHHRRGRDVRGPAVPAWGLNVCAAQIGTLLASVFPAARRPGCCWAKGWPWPRWQSGRRAAGSLTPPGNACSDCGPGGLPGVVTPFLRLYVTASSLAIGYLSGLVVAARDWLGGAAHGTLASPPTLGRPSPQADDFAGSGQNRSGWSRRWLEPTLLIAAVGPSLMLLAVPLSDAARHAHFFGSDALALAALLTLVAIRLKAGRTGPAVSVGR